MGAGPSGSHTAGRLAALGYKVIVIEEHAQAGKTTCCTGIVGKECIDTFSVDPEVILRESASATFFSPSEKSIRMEKDSVQAYIVDRHAFDASLAMKAQEHGADYLWKSRINRVSPRCDSIQVEVESSKITIEGKILVIASGFNSRLTEKVGLGKVGDFAVGAQAEVEVEGIDEVEVYFGRQIAPGFFAWLVPTSHGKALIGLLSRRSPGTYLRELMSTLQAKDKIACNDAKISYGGIPLKPLSRTYRERIVVVGDAAGQIKPTTGGGIYYGLICADKAVDTLHHALSTGNFSDKTFAGYERAWKERLSGDLRAGCRARWLFEHLSDRRIDRTFTILESRGIHQALLDSPDFSFDWHRNLIMKGLRQLGARGVLQMLRPF